MGDNNLYWNAKNFIWIKERTVEQTYCALTLCGNWNQVNNHCIRQMHPELLLLFLCSKNYFFSLEEPMQLWWPSGVLMTYGFRLLLSWILDSYYLGEGVWCLTLQEPELAGNENKNKTKQKNKIHANVKLHLQQEWEWSHRLPKCTALVSHFPCLYVSSSSFTYLMMTWNCWNHFFCTSI